MLSTSTRSTVRCSWSRAVAKEAVTFGRGTGCLLEPAPIVGRRAELGEAGRLAAAGRLLTLTGPPGIGKSRLALELAHRTESEYRDGAVAVDLAPVPDATFVAVTVATAVGARLSPGRAAAEIVREHVHARQLLLVLDNCEHLVTACAQLADALLRDAPGVRILTTSRESLRIHGEVVWAVPPLTAEDAAALLTREALAAGASAFTSDELDLIRDLCVSLEGIPLAVQLAAARVPALGIAQVAELLDDRLGFLAGRSRVDPPRHRTMRAALDWSFQLLNPTEQRVMARLATFAGGWNLEAARDVCGRGGISHIAVMEALEGLVEKSVVGVEDSSGDRRYRFLETVREYATERLEAGSEVVATRDRHAAYFLALSRGRCVDAAGHPLSRRSRSTPARARQSPCGPAVAARHRQVRRRFAHVPGTQRVLVVPRLPPRGRVLVRTISGSS